MTSELAHAKAATRRRFLATLGLAAPFGLAAGRGLALTRVAPPFDPRALPICRAAAPGDVAPPGELKKISFAWNAGAPCLLAITVAKDKGFFVKHGLDVDLINYAGSTDQLLETLATGKADAAVGMALRWLKPMEQGFDVKIVASLHGGCMRLLAPADSGINQVADLKGKIIGVSDMNSPAKNFFAIVIRKAGLAGLGGLRQHVCGTDRHGAHVHDLRERPVQGPRPRAILPEVGFEMVTVATVVAGRFRAASWLRRNAVFFVVVIALGDSSEV
jgi:ABC-type amino acid transport substrate-binding protein